MRFSRRGWCCAVLLVVLAACSQPAGGDKPLGLSKPIAILISIDGWRWDYLDRFTPPTLTRLASQGVRADGLIPQFPSKTFPNHYTIVTGLRLANHGIISNNMRAPDISGEFSPSNRDVQADPRWWGGEPIWNTAERQGKIAAPMFWPGSETAIGGHQATFWTKFDGALPHRDRVNRMLEWLKLPEGKRPSFLTLYYGDVDSAGHDRGPDSDEVRDAALRVDASIGELVAGVTAAGLADRVHYIVVSDHGMAALSPERTIVLDDYLDPSTVDVIDWGPVLGLSPKDGNADQLYATLKGKHPSLAMYRRNEIPAEYRLANHPRLPAVFAIVDEGWFVASRSDLEEWKEPGRHFPGGAHGYDSRFKSMHGLFIASGPRLVTGVRVPAFENIHVYDLLCAILGIEPAKNDGDPAVTRNMLRIR